MKKKLHSDPAVIKNILHKCDSCFMGMVDENNKPYVVPFNFGFDGNHLYFHSGTVGKKMNILNKNNNVCVAFSTDQELFHRDDNVACSYGMKYRSVLAFGKIEFVTDYEQKVKILNVIMQKYTGKDFKYNAPAVNNVAVYKLLIEDITVKELGYF
ncbi:MAG: pyridoxamine 5'-phosphate oxidase family protein [Bacteroidales bacterium]|nr:pyridoxamine 5'-phosphate oxidase family protein [Bacteroidales bacterium]